jgi:hypothetical protein
MILFCNICKTAHHDADMYNESLCYSCFYAGSARVIKDVPDSLVVGPDPDIQLKLF